MIGRVHAVSLLLGITVGALICSPGGMALPVWLAWRNYRKFTSAMPLLNCDQVNRAVGRLPRRVAVAGRTLSAEPPDLLRAPMSGAACVWHQVGYFRPGPPSFEEYGKRWDEASSPLVEITDGAAVVHVTPQLADKDLFSSFRSGIATKTATGTTPGHDGRKVRWQERVIRPGVPVVVVGRPVRTATGIVLAEGSTNPTGITTLPIGQVRRRYAARFKLGAAMLLVLPALAFAILGVITLSG